MVIQEIREELEKQADPAWKRKLTQWYGQDSEKPKFHGIPTPHLRKLSAAYYARVRNKTKLEMFQLCEELLASGFVAERTIAFDWAFRLRKHYGQADFHILESWLKNHVHDWGACDDLCTHAFGAFTFQFPELIPTVKDWTKSTSTWIRRASAVTMIYSARRKKHLEEIFEIADALLADQDLMAQKGYGWMLKEASNKYPQEVFNYVLKHRKEMPRTALRYAIEKLSPALRKEAMKREN